MFLGRIGIIFPEGWVLNPYFFEGRLRIRVLVFLRTDLDPYLLRESDLYTVNLFRLWRQSAGTSCSSPPVSASHFQGSYYDNIRDNNSLGNVDQMKIFKNWQLITPGI